MPFDDQVTLKTVFSEVEPPFLIYCNNSEMGLTPWDVRIKFMEVFDREGEAAVIRRHGTVVVSPQHAKAMLEALTETIRVYESKFGEIDLARIKELAAVKSPSLL
jgi:hypothetical protein